MRRVPERTHQCCCRRWYIRCTAAHVARADATERWLGLIAATLKPRTLEGHRYVLNLHILPALGGVKVRQVHKGQIRAFLALKLESGRLPRPEKEVARGAPETREKAGEAWRIRTSDSLLKRQELYQTELTGRTCAR